MLDGRWGKTRCVLMKRNCVLFYLITVLREGNQARFELFSKIFLTFQWNVDCISLSVCLWYAKKDMIYA